MYQKISIALASIIALVGTSGVALAGGPIAVVPEPAALTLFAGGIGVIAVARYLKRK